MIVSYIVQLLRHYILAVQCGLWASLKACASCLKYGMLDFHGGMRGFFRDMVDQIIVKLVGFTDLT
jgi:hypothetical protein